MKPNLPTSFDDLMKNRYGSARPNELTGPATVEELFASYYGKAATLKTQKIKAPPSVVQSLSYDDGELLNQFQPDQHGAAGERPCEEYVVAQSSLGSYSVAAEEPAATEDVTPFQEYCVNVLDPLSDSSGQARAAGGEAGVSQPVPATSQTASCPGCAQKPTRRTTAAAPPSLAGISHKATDDDFLADMQSILTGQKVFDPRSKKTVDKDKLGQPAAAASPDSAGAAPLPDAKNSQAIFDRIAESMQYANKFNLGTVELENRLADFDRMAEIEERAARTKKARSRPPAAVKPAAKTVDTTDFLQDLQSIQRQRARTASYLESKRAGSANEELDRPFYDTGEHVLAGGDVYTDRLRVGKDPGVPFSYGQIIAMGDLYETVKDMMEADVAELQRVKVLIERSTSYYRHEKTWWWVMLSGHLDVSNSEWDAATRGRFLELAEKNYPHFSPADVLQDPLVLAMPPKEGDNRSAWESYHRQAIEAMQQLFLDYPNQSVFPEWPLTVNAFGDHFLTDAFAAGHLVNKEAMIDDFKANFFQNGELRPEGDAFFGRVAELAFRGEVKDKFSKLETADWVFYKGFIPVGHPDINSTSRFKTLLVEAAKQQTDIVANLTVKALHDRLNKEGVEVSNEAGDGTWRLTGDGTLDKRNLAIIQKAVQQSIDNIVDGPIYQSNLNFGPLFEKVWKHVPRPTEASHKKLSQLMKDYTRPDSQELTAAAAQLIHDQLDALIGKLKKLGKLRDA
jgi:hypothetical protein